MDLRERAGRYASKCEASVSGSGGHDAAFKVAVALVVGFELSEEDALGVMMTDFNPRCAPPWKESELRHKVRSAASASPPEGKSRGWLIGSSARTMAKKGSKGSKGGSRSSGSGRTRDWVPSPPPARPEYRPEALRARAHRLEARAIVLSSEWLGNRSKVDPFRCSAEMFLDGIARDGEKFVVLVDGSAGKGDFLYDAEQMAVIPLRNRMVWDEEKGAKVWQCEALAPVAAFPSKVLDTPGGALFLNQPVNGLAVPNGDGELSWRSQPNVVDWRYLVLESDIPGIAREWLAFLVQLPEAVEAIYTSGGKSIHALLRVDAASKEEWDARRERYKAALVAYGADPAAMSAVRLTRLPGMRRAGRLQKLLYFNPGAGLDPIADLPVRRDVRALYEGSPQGCAFYKLNQKGNR